MEENIPKLSGSEAPAGYLESLRRSALEPEKSLLLAVLEDAVACFQKYSVAQDPRGKEMFREAEHWIMQAKNGWLFSFDNVCDLLGLDPAYLRQGLRCWQKRTVQGEETVIPGAPLARKPRRERHAFLCGSPGPAQLGRAAVLLCHSVLAG